MMLLRNAKTGQFFSNGSWIYNRESAQRFADIAAAIATCNRYGLENAELVTHFDFGDSEPDDICSPPSIR